MKFNDVAINVLRCGWTKYDLFLIVFNLGFMVNYRRLPPRQIKLTYWPLTDKPSV